jgi:hypothetical protein
LHEIDELRIKATVFTSSRFTHRLGMHLHSDIDDNMATPTAAASATPPSYDQLKRENEELKRRLQQLEQGDHAVKPPQIPPDAAAAPSVSSDGQASCGRCVSSSACATTASALWTADVAAPSLWEAAARLEKGQGYSTRSRVQTLLLPTPDELAVVSGIPLQYAATALSFTFQADGQSPSETLRFACEGEFRVAIADMLSSHFRLASSPSSAALSSSPSAACCVCGRPAVVSGPLFQRIRQALFHSADAADFASVSAPLLVQQIRTGAVDLRDALCKLLEVAVAAASRVPGHCNFSYDWPPPSAFPTGSIGHWGNPYRWHITAHMVCVMSAEERAQRFSRVHLPRWTPSPMASTSTGVFPQTAAEIAQMWSLEFLNGDCDSLELVEGTCRNNPKKVLEGETLTASATAAAASASSVAAEPSSVLPARSAVGCDWEWRMRIRFELVAAIQQIIRGVHSQALFVY